MTPLLEQLTAREETVLLMLGDGHGLREIGRRLGISHWTVKSHRDNGRRKLGAPTTTAAAVIVRERRRAKARAS